jgi:hypothetical protein
VGGYYSGEKKLEKTSKITFDDVTFLVFLQIQKTGVSSLKHGTDNGEAVFI